MRVAAAGVSRAAMHLLTGTPYLLRLAGFGLRAPKQPVVGNEVAGVVAAVGADVTGFAQGDEVFGYASGSCAELAVAKASKLAHKPAELTFVEAAATVDSASTALQAVRDHAAVRPGQRVLVLGAPGGVGSFVVQVAADAGAEVTATAQTAKLAFVRSLGAAHVVDHTTTDPLAVDPPYDVIIDIGGNRPVRRLRKALAADGTLVIVGGEGGGRVTGGFQRQLLAPLRAIGSSQTPEDVRGERERRRRSTTSPPWPWPVGSAPPSTAPTRSPTAPKRSAAWPPARSAARTWWRWRPARRGRLLGGRGRSGSASRRRAGCRSGRGGPPRRWAGAWWGRSSPWPSRSG